MQAHTCKHIHASTYMKHIHASPSTSPTPLSSHRLLPSPLSTYFPLLSPSTPVSSLHLLLSSFSAPAISCISFSHEPLMFIRSRLLFVSRIRTLTSTHTLFDPHTILPTRPAPLTTPSLYPLYSFSLPRTQTCVSGRRSGCWFSSLPAPPPPSGSLRVIIRTCIVSEFTGPQGSGEGGKGGGQWQGGEKWWWCGAAKWQQSTEEASCS